MLVYQRVVSTQIEKSDGDQPSTSWCGNLENPFRIRRVVSMVSRGSGLPPVSHAKNIVFVDGFPLSPPSPCTLGEGHERSEPHRWAVQMSAESWTDGKSPWLNIALPCHVVASKNDQSLGGSDQWPSLCLSISIYGGSQFKLMESGKTPIWLVVTGTWISFFHILGISSSQLPISIIFQRGRLNHQPGIQMHRLARMTFLVIVGNTHETSMYETQKQLLIMVTHSHKHT
jgi:hypothetical protein